MKRLALVLTLALAACEGGGGNGDMTPKADMAMSPDLRGGVGGGGAEMDLATLPSLSCGETLQCMGGCGMDQACSQGCIGMASSGARQKLQVMVQCLFTKCMAADGGAAACASTMDASAACQQCLNGELQMPTVCQAQVGDCLND